MAIEKISDRLNTDEHEYRRRLIFSNGNKKKDVCQRPAHVDAHRTHEKNQHTSSDLSHCCVWMAKHDVFTVRSRAMRLTTPCISNVSPLDDQET
jgi:hypothetical protein